MHEPTHDIWIVRSRSNAGVLCTRKTQPLVHPGICRVMCARLGLRIPAGRLAVWARGNHLVRSRRPPLVASRDHESTAGRQLIIQPN